jgi:hypothetical protein
MPRQPMRTSESILLPSTNRTVGKCASARERLPLQIFCRQCAFHSLKVTNLDACGDDAYCSPYCEHGAADPQKALKGAAADLSDTPHNAGVVTAGAISLVDIIILSNARRQGQGHDGPCGKDKQAQEAHVGIAVVQASGRV